MDRRMIPQNNLDIGVEVPRDGAWWPGFLEHWRSTSTGRWEGWVRYTIAPGTTYVAWVDEDDIRKV